MNALPPRLTTPALAPVVLGRSTLPLFSDKSPLAMVCVALKVFAPVEVKAVGGRPPSRAAFTLVRPEPLPVKLLAVILPPKVLAAAVRVAKLVADRPPSRLALRLAT